MITDIKSKATAPFRDESAPGPAPVLAINENQQAVPKNLRSTLNADLLWVKRDHCSVIRGYNGSTNHLVLIELFCTFALIFF